MAATKNNDVNFYHRRPFDSAKKLHNLVYLSFALSPMVIEIFKSLNTVCYILGSNVNLMGDEEN
jgi:hypothetical protein